MDVAAGVTLLRVMNQGRFDLLGQLRCLTGVDYPSGFKLCTQRFVRKQRLHNVGVLSLSLGGVRALLQLLQDYIVHNFIYTSV